MKGLRKFFYLNPNMISDGPLALTCRNAIWLTDAHRDGGCFGVGAKDHNKGKIVNRRIRHMPFKEEERNLHYSEYKKMFSPVDYGIL